MPGQMLLVLRATHMICRRHSTYAKGPISHMLTLQKEAAYVHCARQTALERQDLPCTYLAHHELESEFIDMLSLFIYLFIYYINVCRGPFSRRQQDGIERHTAPHQRHT